MELPSWCSGSISGFEPEEPSSNLGEGATGENRMKDNQIPNYYTPVSSPPRSRVVVIECVFDLKDINSLNVDVDLLEHLQQWGTAVVIEDKYVIEDYDVASAICRKRAIE